MSVGRRNQSGPKLLCTTRKTVRRLPRMEFIIPDDPPEVVFPFERLQTYQAARAFLGLIDPIVRDKKCGTAEMRDQLHRAGLSFKLNIAEGATEYSKPDKIRFFRISSRSAGECVAVLDEFGRWQCIDPLTHRKARYVLNAGIGMLTRLITSIRP